MTLRAKGAKEVGTYYYPSLGSAYMHVHSNVHTHTHTRTHAHTLTRARTHTCSFPMPHFWTRHDISFKAPHVPRVPTEGSKSIPFCLRDPMCYLPHMSLGSSHISTTGAEQLWDPLPDPDAHHRQGCHLAIRKAIEGLADRVIPVCSAAAKLEGWLGSVRG